MLAIWWAVAKLTLFLQRIASFQVVTDQKPLVGVSTKPMEAILNLRLQCFREKIVPFLLDIIWLEVISLLMSLLYTWRPFSSIPAQTN